MPVKFKILFGCCVRFFLYMIISRSEQSYSHAVLDRFLNWFKGVGFEDVIVLFSCYRKGNWVQLLGNNIILMTILLTKQNNSMQVYLWLNMKFFLPTTPGHFTSCLLEEKQYENIAKCKWCNVNKIMPGTLK